MNDDILKSLLNKTLKDIMSSVEAECGSFFLFDSRHNELILNSFHNSGSLNLLGLKKKVGEGIVGRPVGFNIWPGFIGVSPFGTLLLIWVVAGSAFPTTPLIALTFFAFDFVETAGFLTVLRLTFWPTVPAFTRSRYLTFESRLSRVLRAALDSVTWAGPRTVRPS